MSGPSDCMQPQKKMSNHMVQLCPGGHTPKSQSLVTGAHVAAAATQAQKRLTFDPWIVCPA